MKPGAYGIEWLTEISFAELDNLRDQTFVCVFCDCFMHVLCVTKPL